MVVGQQSRPSREIHTAVSRIPCFALSTVARASPPALAEAFPFASPASLLELADRVQYLPPKSTKRGPSAARLFWRLPSFLLITFAPRPRQAPQHSPTSSQPSRTPSTNTHNLSQPGSSPASVLRFWFFAFHHIAAVVPIARISNLLTRQSSRAS